MSAPRRVIVCGSRDWTDGDLIRRELRLLPPGSTIVHGAARGADRIAGQVARTLGLTVEEHPANWRILGRGAGPARNFDMLRTGCDFVVAFKDRFDRTLRTGGTEHMVAIATAAGVPCRIVDHGPESAPSPPSGDGRTGEQQHLTHFRP